MPPSPWHGVALLVLLVAVLPGTATEAQAAGDAGPSARSEGCATPACWASARPQAASLRTGAAVRLTFSRAGLSTVRLTPSIRGRLTSPIRGGAPEVTATRVRGLAPIAGLTTRGARGLVLTPGDVVAAPLALRFAVGGRRVAVLAANADGTDLHRIPTWRGRVDVPVSGPMAIVVIPGAATSPWFRAGPRAHLPATPWFKLPHVLAGLSTSRGPSGRPFRPPAWVAGGPTAAGFADRSAEVFARYREYIDWLRAKHAGDPSRAVEDVARVWGAMVHHEAVAAELGLADPDDVDRDSHALSEYLTESVDAWLAQLTRPCLRQGDTAVVLRLLRFAQLRGLPVTTGPADLDGCPVRITGQVTVRTQQDLLSDRANGGHNIIESTAGLRVRLLARGLLGYGATPESPEVVDEGTTVDFTGSTDYHPRSDAATCAELIADGYTKVTTVLGPYAGPVASVSVRRGDTGLVALQAEWPYMAHESTLTLFPTESGCDWNSVERILPRTEQVEAVGLVTGPTTTITIDSWPDPFTHATGSLTIEEVMA